MERHTNDQNTVNQQNWGESNPDLPKSFFLQKASVMSGPNWTPTPRLLGALPG